MCNQSKYARFFFQGVGGQEGVECRSSKDFNIRIFPNGSTYWLWSTWSSVSLIYLLFMGLELEASSNEDIHRSTDIPDLWGQALCRQVGYHGVFKKIMLSPSQLQQGSSLFFTLPGGHGALPYTPLLHMLSFLQMLSVFSRKKRWKLQMS